MATSSTSEQSSCPFNAKPRGPIRGIRNSAIKHDTSTDTGLSSRKSGIVTNKPKEKLALPPPPRNEDKEEENDEIHWSSIIVFAVLVVASSAVLNRFVLKPQSRQSCNHFLHLRSTYPNTDEMLWATLIVGVERALNNPGEPATFIFLHSSSSVDQSLLNDVITLTIKCFGNEDAIWRTSNDFKSADETPEVRVLLDQYREELKSQGVLVVRDLDKVPANAAQVFFTICDSYEPLVQKAVIFFTIDISQQAQSQLMPNSFMGCSATLSGATFLTIMENLKASARQHQESVALHLKNEIGISPTSIAEKILKDLWRKKLDSNMLDPLVVRLTENVFKIE